MAKSKEKVKILVIDDDPKVSWILQEGLSKKYEFVSARDGIEGIQMVSTEQPMLILLDIKMPGMSGIEVLERLNKAESRPEVWLPCRKCKSRKMSRTRYMPTASTPPPAPWRP